MANPTKPSVRMTDEEAWGLVELSLNGILTTLRRDGRPVALPVWFVVIDRKIYVQTRGKKVVRARRDPRASFLVEAGHRWAELRAVHLDCDAAVIEPPPELAARIGAAMNEKYAGSRTASSSMPEATRDHYRHASGATIELTLTGRMLTWDNRKLALTATRAAGGVEP